MGENNSADNNCCSESSTPAQAIFRGCKSAYALDVLYHQAELLHLMQDWADLVKEDQHPNDGEKRDFDTYFLKLGFPKEGEEYSAQWVQWREIRQKLKDYRLSIATFRDISSEPKPDPVDIQTLRAWLKAPGGGNDFLRGSEAETWQESEDDDLITLQGIGEKDALSKWISGPVMSWIHNHITDRFMKEAELRDPFLSPTPFATPLKKYSDPAIEGVVTSVSIVLASLFPALSIFALAYVQNQAIRLGMIMVFCVLFSIALVVIAKARKIDCFAATAAFAAVQVVFIGQQGSACVCAG